MLQVLLNEPDPSELHVSGPDGGPIRIAAVIATVQSALGMRPNPDPRQSEGCVRTANETRNLSLSRARQMFENGVVPSMVT